MDDFKEKILAKRARKRRIESVVKKSLTAAALIGAAVIVIIRKPLVRPGVP